MIKHKNKTHFLYDIPFHLEKETVIKDLRLNKLKRDWIDASKLIKEISPLINACAVYKEGFISGRGEDWVEIEGIRFSSRILSRNIEKIEKVYPYVITIGSKLESKAKKEKDLLKQYFLESLGDMALISARQSLCGHLEAEYKIANLSNMSPGSLKDWPIGEQKPLFKLLGEGCSKIEVRITDSLLMIPRKSLSGIYFASEKGFSSCQICPRKNCQGRVVPYDKNLEKKYYSD